MSRIMENDVSSNAQQRNISHKFNLLDLPPLSSPADMNSDPATLDAHLQQSSHLISMLRMSLGPWIVASEVSRERKIGVLKRYSLPTVAVDMPQGIAFSKGRMLEYMELCAGYGITSIEYTDLSDDPVLKAGEMVRLANDYDLNVQYKISTRRGNDNEREFEERLIKECTEWLDAGARCLVADPFDNHGSRLLASRRLRKSFSDMLASAFGLHSVLFEAPVMSNQEMLINHFGPDVHLCGLPLEDVLKIEIYRRQPFAGFFGGAQYQERLVRRNGDMQPAGVVQGQLEENQDGSRLSSPSGRKR